MDAGSRTRHLLALLVYFHCTEALHGSIITYLQKWGGWALYMEMGPYSGDYG